jgi:putative tryptophan/tyrosine transport system substrate-binding protein
MQFDLLKRRDFITLLGGAMWPLVVWASRSAKMLRVALLAVVTLLAAQLASEAQQLQKIPRLCFLSFGPDTLQSQSPRFDAFFDSLRDLGYVNGKTIAIDYLSADGDGERFPALAAECVRLNADIIVVSTTPAARAAKTVTRTIPILMIALGDPVGTGLVDGLARPGGNVTGTSLMVPELAAKRLGLLKEAVPGLTRVLVLSYLADPIAPLQVTALKEAARSLGVTLQLQDIRSGDDLAAAFEAGVKARVEGLITTAESLFIVHRAQVSELAARNKLPAIYPYSIQVTDGGGLMAYEADIPDLHRRTATYADRILKGAKPSDLPVQQPTKLKFVLNLKIARALGLDLPNSILALADEVIE